MQPVEANDAQVKPYAANSWRYRLWADLITAIIFPVEKLISLFVPRKIIFQNIDFPWIERIENEYPALLEEFNKLCRETDQLPDWGKISAEEGKLVKTNQWNFIPLYIYGNKIDFICKKLPCTTTTLQNIPDLTTAFFSVLNPHAKIAEHRGTFKGYLRYHMGIRIPEPPTSCGLKVKDQVFNWYNGKSVVFDDTFRHIAWNNSDQVRVVLWVDFIRPMPYPLKKISLFITKLVSRSPYVQNILAGLSQYKFNAELPRSFD